MVGSVGEHGMCLDAEELGEDVIDFLVQEQIWLYDQKIINVHGNKWKKESFINNGVKRLKTRVLNSKNSTGKKMKVSLKTG